MLHLRLLYIAARNLNIVDVDSTGGAIEEHQARVGCRVGQVSVDRADQVAVEPGLALAGRRLRVLHLDTVPGVGTQSIGGREDRVGAARTVPEVDVQSFAVGIVVDLPDVVAVDVAPHSQHGAVGQAAQAEVEACEGLALGATGQGGVEIDVLAAGVGEGSSIGAAVDHGTLDGGLPGAVGVGQRPFAEVATLEAIAEVDDGRLARASQGHALWAACCIVGDGHTGTAAAVGAR